MTTSFAGRVLDVDPRRRSSWTATDLAAATFPEPRWAVPGVVPEGLTFCAGAPKLGKSWLALNMCISVAAGGRALGKVEVEQGEVLYLALEDPPRRLQQRMVTVLEGAPPPAGLHFETEWPRLAEGGADQLGAWLQEHPATRLVVVDVFARVRTIAGDNTSAYAADYLAAVPLKALADAHGLAIVVLHHTRKAAAEDFVETVSGTHGLAAAADSVLVMRRARNSADATLAVTGRDVEEAEHAMRFDRGAWTLLEGPAQDYEMSDTRRSILHLLRERGPMRPKEIALALSADYELVKKTTRRMAGDDQLDTDGAGHYFTRNPVPSVPAVPGTSGTSGAEGPEGQEGQLPVGGGEGS
ncbi:hypothetical protein BH20ACT9_BH20ACT9_06020 [soil metagenome]